VLEVRQDLAVRTAVLPWQIVRVHGPSMTPTLRTGDRVLVRHGARIRPGDVVLAAFDDLPGIPVIKRAVRREADGRWWVSSDNAFAGGDSSVHGAATVSARASAILGGSRGILRRLPHRIPANPTPAGPLD
jgi:hypothetical protein